MTAAGACSNEPSCLLEDYRASWSRLSSEGESDPEHRCIDAMRIAARYGSDLRPAQEEVDTRLEFLALARSPDERFATIHDDSPEAWDAIEILTDRAEVLAAWSRGQVLTGYGAVDALLEEAGAIAVRYDGDHRLEFATPVNVPIVIAAFEALDGFTAGVTAGGMDGEQIDLVGETDVRFEIAWGDCFVGCSDRHYWLVRVDPGAGTAEIIDEGGDPVPETYFHQ